MLAEEGSISCDYDSARPRMYSSGSASSGQNLQSEIGPYLRVSLAHRIVHLVVPRIADKFSALVESLEKETVRPLADQKDLHIGHRLASGDSRPASGFVLCPAIRSRA